MNENYAVGGLPKIIFAPSELSLYLITITYNCLESC